MKLIGHLGLRRGKKVGSSQVDEKEQTFGKNKFLQGHVETGGH